MATPAVFTYSKSADRSLDILERVAPASWWFLPFQERTAKWVSWLSLAGMLMPVGILAELLLGAPPLFVLIGATSMIASVTWLGIAVARLRLASALGSETTR